MNRRTGHPKFKYKSWATRPHSVANVPRTRSVIGGLDNKRRGQTVQYNARDVVSTRIVPETLQGHATEKG